MATHCLVECQDAVISEIVDNKPTPKQRQQMETLDRQFVEFQKCAERRCRKIIKPELEFSPQAGQTLAREDVGIQGSDPLAQGFGVQPNQRPLHCGAQAAP